MQKNRNPPAFCLVWAWDVAAAPASRSNTVPDQGRRLMVERHGFHMAAHTKVMVHLCILKRFADGTHGSLIAQ